MSQTLCWAWSYSSELIKQIHRPNRAQPLMRKERKHKHIYVWENTEGFTVELLRRALNSVREKALQADEAAQALSGAVWSGTGEQQRARAKGSGREDEV